MANKTPKKRNKKYVPKTRQFPKNIPLGKRNPHALEIPFLTAMNTLGTPHFSEQMLGNLIEFGMIAAHLGGPEEWNPYVDAVDSIAERHGRTGKFGATGDEMRAIREIGPKILSFVAEKSNHEIVRVANTIKVDALKSLSKAEEPNTTPPNMPPKEDGSDSYVPYGDHITCL